MSIRTSLQQMIAAANEQVDELAAGEAIALVGLAQYQFIDLRDSQELAAEGTIPGAFHCPRGVLEFWADPESEDVQPAFQTEHTLVLFCAGGLRSALAAKTLQDLGFERVKHIAGGYSAWKQCGGPIEHC